MTPAIAGNTVAVGVIGDFVIAIVSCIELLNHKTSTIV
jgi:hypothetical protein